MRKNHRINITADIVILLCSIILCGVARFSPYPSSWPAAILAVFVLCAALAAADLIYQMRRKKAQEDVQSSEERFGAREQGIGRLILLDEQDKPVKSWDMAGRISIVIGRAGGEEDVDVDLEDCAFSGFVDFQHAVLNFCLEQWYVEDLGSQNGVKIRKAEDGECYRVIGRPCRVEAGDILYIANTRLLLS